jgi:hypothetical protein
MMAPIRKGNVMPLVPKNTATFIPQLRVRESLFALTGRGGFLKLCSPPVKFHLQVGKQSVTLLAVSAYFTDFRWSGKTGRPPKKFGKMKCIPENLAG